MVLTSTWSQEIVKIPRKKNSILGLSEIMEAVSEKLSLRDKKKGIW